MPDFSVFKTPPTVIDNLDLTREVTALYEAERYRSEEFSDIDLGGRVVAFMRGNLVGTFELSGAPDTPQGRADWILVMTRSRTKYHDGKFFAFSFWGDQDRCLTDLFHLRLAV